jgi:hypothetical protein
MTPVMICSGFPPFHNRTPAWHSRRLAIHLQRSSWVLLFAIWQLLPPNYGVNPITRVHRWRYDPPHRLKSSGFLGNACGKPTLTFIIAQTYNAGKFRLKPQNKPAYPAGELGAPESLSTSPPRIHQSVTPPARLLALYPLTIR